MFPYEITLVEETTNKEIKDDFKGQRNGYCQVGPKKWCLPFEYKTHAEQYYNFELRKDDLWIVTYPRSGTTWTQELLWLVNNDFDFKTAGEIPLSQRFPFLEFNIIHSKQFTDEIIELNERSQDVIDEIKRRHTPGYVYGKTMQSPRHIKSHLPLSLLPPKLLDTCKVVYVARNPKDVAASYYHHNRRTSIIGYTGDFNKYWNYFERDLVMYSPYWEHIQEAWDNKNHSNMLFLFYEDLINDMPGCIKKVCRFLNKTINDDLIDRLCKHLHIDNFKLLPVLQKTDIKGMANTNAEPFIRRGKIGGNKELEGEIVTRVDKWVEDNLSKTDITFPIKLL